MISSDAMKKALKRMANRRNLNNARGVPSRAKGVLIVKMVIRAWNTIIFKCFAQRYATGSRNLQESERRIEADLLYL